MVYLVGRAAGYDASRAAFATTTGGSATESNATNVSRPTLFELPRSALARQYAALTDLGAPRADLELKSLSSTTSYDRGRARHLATTWARTKRELWRRCEKLMDSGDEIDADGDRVRWFATSERKDFAGYVTEELLELGLCPVNVTTVPPKRRVDLYFGEQFESENAPRWASPGSRLEKVVSAGASVGSIEGLMSIFGSKDSYAHLFWHCKDLVKRKLGRRVLCPNSWLPSFNVFGTEDKRSDKFKRQIIRRSEVPYFERLFDLARGAKSPTWWIVKPQKGTFLSRGMHLSLLKAFDLNSQNALLSWVANNVIEPGCKEKRQSSVRCDRRMVTFQMYVHKPALFHGRKFDMRLWLVVTSVEPLRLFLLRHAYPKVASRPFVDDHGRIEDQCVHIKMLLDPSCNVSLREFSARFPYGFPRSTASPVFFQGLHFPGLIKQAQAKYGGPKTHHAYRADRKRPRDWPVKEQFWSRHVWPAIETALAKIVMLVRPNLTRGRRRPFYQPFALLSPDVTLDENGHVYVEEINTNGLVMGTHMAAGGAGNLFFDNAYVKSLLQIVGADGFPRSRSYDDRLDVAVRRFCNQTEDSSSCTPAAVDAMRRAVHEEAHAGRHFYRLYPPLVCFERENSSPCRLDADADDRPPHAHHWPNHLQLSEAVYAAMPESPLDRLVRRFLATTDTELIHGVPQVPGHARWPPRSLDGVTAV